MTQRAPSERAVQALQTIGMTASPLTSLERDEALFVLTGDTLLFQDADGTRRVTLRDLTRIHSDQEGTLRVETPAGTALTASLLGFDPAQVQAFFGQVRDATAQAKERAAAQEEAQAAAGVAPEPAARPAPQPTAQPTPAPMPESAPMPEPAPAPAPIPTPAPAPTPTPVSAAPVVISSSGFSPSRTPDLTKAPVSGRSEVAPEPEPTPVAVMPASVPVTPAAPVPAGVPLRGAASAVAALARQAELVDGLTGRLRVLGAVLFVASVALAFFQFSGGQPLAALWTLLAGGVGTIALMALADIARLLVALARASSASGGVMDVD